MTKTIWILAITAAFVAGSIATGTIVTAQSDTIIACVHDKSNGKNVRIVESADECRNNETAVEWNKEGPQGPAGPEGPQGPQGPIPNLTVVERKDPTPGVFKAGEISGPTGSFAVCQPGEIVVSGGYEASAALMNIPIERRSGNGWEVLAAITGPPPGDLTITAIAYCAKLVPP